MLIVQNIVKYTKGGENETSRFRNKKDEAFNFVHKVENLILRILYEGFIMACFRLQLKVQQRRRQRIKVGGGTLFCTMKIISVFMKITSIK